MDKLLVLDECCLRHIPYEILNKIPTEHDWDYPIPFVRIDKKDKRAWILIDNKDSKATWIEIGNDINAIEKILLDCGEVTPNENGEIIHTGECGARTVTDDCKDLCITINTDWGLKGGGNVCAGESITLSIDPENTNLVSYSSNDVKDGDSVVFDGTSGNMLKRAMNWRVGNATDSWTGRFNAEDKSFEIFPNEMSDKPIIQMLNNGVVLEPWQPKCTARLTESTPKFSTNTPYAIGSTRAFQKLRDTDGYDLNANHFFPGDGQGNGAYYTCPYSGTYNIGWQFVVDRTNASDETTRITCQLLFGTLDSNEQAVFYNYVFGKTTYQTISEYIALPLEKGNRIRWDIIIDSGEPYLSVRATGNQIDNFISISFVG